MGIGATVGPDVLLTLMIKVDALTCTITGVGRNDGATVGEVDTLGTSAESAAFKRDSTELVAAAASP